MNKFSRVVLLVALIAGSAVSAAADTTQGAVSIANYFILPIPAPKRCIAFSARPPPANTGTHHSPPHIARLHTYTLAHLGKRRSACSGPTPFRGWACFQIVNPGGAVDFGHDLLYNS